MNFLFFAVGSCNETKSQLYHAFDFEYVTENDLQETFELIEKLSAGIKALMAYLKKSDIKGNKFKKP